MIHFTLLETLVLAGILQAIVLVVAFGRKLKRSSRENYFYVLIVISAIMLLARLLAFKFESVLVYRFAIFADVTIFLFGPISYLYLKKQFSARSKVSPIHFLPSICHFVFFIWTCLLSSERLAIQYQAGTLPMIFFFIESLGLVSIGTYLVLSITEFRTYLFGHKKQPVIFLITTWSLTVIAWLVGYLDTYFLAISSKVPTYDLIWMVVPVWIHLVGYFKLVEIKEKVKKIRPRVSRVKKEKQQLIIQELEKVAETSLLFSDADLKLDDLAREVNSSPNDLSWVLNEVYQMTFYEFVNKVRLNAFIDKVKKREHHQKTLLALSFEVGFKSKSTFNNAFKAVYNQTPSQYISKNHWQQQI